MSHKHKIKIEKIFEHPMSGNIEAKKLIAALEHYGADVDQTKHGRVKINLKGEEFVLSLSHNGNLSKDSIAGVRHFLEKVNLVPGEIE